MRQRSPFPRMQGWQAAYLLLLPLAGCWPFDDDDPEQTVQPPTATTVGSTGGQVQNDAGTVVVSIPAGSLSTPTQVSISPATAIAALSTPFAEVAMYQAVPGTIFQIRTTSGAFDNANFPPTPRIMVPARAARAARPLSEQSGEPVYSFVVDCEDSGNFQVWPAQDDGTGYLSGPSTACGGIGAGEQRSSTATIGLATHQSPRAVASEWTKSVVPRNQVPILLAATTDSSGRSFVAYSVNADIRIVSLASDGSTRYDEKLNVTHAVQHPAQFDDKLQSSDSGALALLLDKYAGAQLFYLREGVSGSATGAKVSPVVMWSQTLASDVAGLRGADMTMLPGGAVAVAAHVGTFIPSTGLHMFSSSGVKQWSKEVTLSSYVRGTPPFSYPPQAVAAGPTGDVVVLQSDASCIAPPDDTCVHLLKYGPQGDTKWDVASPDLNSASGLTLDKDGNAHLVLTKATAPQLWSSFLQSYDSATGIPTRTVQLKDTEGSGSPGGLLVSVAPSGAAYLYVEPHVAPPSPLGEGAFTFKIMPDGTQSIVRLDVFQVGSGLVSSLVVDANERAIAVGTPNIGDLTAVKFAVP